MAQWLFRCISSSAVLFGLYLRVNAALLEQHPARSIHLHFVQVQGVVAVGRRTGRLEWNAPKNKKAFFFGLRHRGVLVLRKER